MTKPFVIPKQERPKLRKSVLERLGHGRGAAITGGQLASRLQYKDDRLIRVMIRELIAEGVPIASSVSPPMGFFIVDDPDEAAKYIRILKERIKEDQARLRDFEAAVAAYSPPEQLSLV